MSVLLGVVAVAKETRAQGYPPPASAYGVSPAETHDGVYLRMGLGAGYLQSSASTSATGELKFSGTAIGLDFALGGVVAPNLILFGEFAFLSVSSPTVTVGGVSGNANGISFDHIGIGPGLAYYIEPANVYVSGALILGKLQIQNDQNTVTNQTEMGFGANIVVGKEWWVSPQWGLGAALQLMLASNKDSGDDARFSTLGAALAFSATFN